MIEYILKSYILQVIIILNNISKSYIFLHKYVSKINWKEFFKNLDKHKSILIFMKKYFKIEYFGNKYLFLASKNGYLKVIKFLLEKGADINAANDFSILQANEKGHLKIVKILLTKGADIHAINHYDLLYRALKIKI